MHAKRLVTASWLGLVLCGPGSTLGAAETPRTGDAGTAPPASKAAPVARAPSSAKAATPDPVVCIASARSVLSDKARQEDTKARSAAYSALRDCLRKLVDGDENMNALQVARAAHEMLPSEPRAGFDYGALLMLTKGDPSQARSVLEAALTQTPHLATPAPSERALAVGNLGSLALARGETAAARDLLRQALALDPEHADFLYDLALADRKAGDVEACLQHVQAAIAKDPSGATRDDYLLASWAMARLDRHADAAVLLRKAVARLPNASGLHLNLGYALARDGRPVEALLEYRYELANGAANDPYVLEARRQFQDALGRDQATPQHGVAIRHLRAAIEEDAGDPAKVLVHVDALERAGYHHSTLDLLRAEALYASKDLAGAEGALRKLIASDPAFVPAYLDLSVVLQGTGKEDEARRLVAEAVKRNPQHWQLAGGEPEASK